MEHWSILDRMIEAYRLSSSVSENGAAVLRAEQRHAAAERQNWRCAYCRVKMFAGTPAEDLRAYASEARIPLRKAGIWWGPSFEALRLLRATTEHLVDWKYRDVFGAEFIQSVDNVIAACLYCNVQRANMGNMDYRKWLHEVERRITAKEHPLYRIIQGKRHFHWARGA